MNNYFIVFYTLLFLSAFSACKNDKKSYYQDNGEIFHTNYNIKYEYSHSLSKEIRNELNRFDNSLNPFNKESVIFQINNNISDVPDSLFIEVFNKSQEVSEISGGLFDITCAPLINAWGFGFKNMENVTPEQIDSLRNLVGYKKIYIENGKVVKTDPRVQINTSAIAKGFSVDIIARLFDSLNIENYMCEIGGEIITKGVNSKGECWHIGIDKPIDEKIQTQRNLQTILKICDKAIATSGNYRNFYVKDGKKYAHTIDPITGYPSTGNILSTTVVADNCMTADAYATTFMLTGIDRAKEIAKELELDIYLIYTEDDGSIVATYSDGFEKYFTE